MIFKLSIQKVDLHMFHLYKDNLCKLCQHKAQMLMNISC